MAADGTGYLIPDNPQPDELNCLLVFYPDDPMYLAALLGAITYMGTWAAWERDPDKRARLAAAAWKEANECTLDSMSCITELVTALTGINQTLVAIQQAIENQSISLDAGDIVTAVNGVQTAIENLEFDSVISEDDMSIVINNCCCCGGASSTTPGIPGIPDDLPPDTAPPTPLQPVEEIEPFPPEEPEQEWLLTECAMAQFLAYTFRKLCIDIANGDFTQANMVAKLATYLPGAGWDFIGGAAQLALALISIMSNLVGAGTIASEIDNKFETIKCALLNRSMTSSQRVSAIRTLIDTMSLPTLTRYAMKFIAGYIPVYYVFDLNTLAYAQSYLQDNGFFAAGCPGCVDTGGYPDPTQSGLYIRDHTSTSNQLWWSTDNTIFAQIGTTGQPFYFNRLYYITDHPTVGTGAMHCQLTSTPTANAIVCDVDVTNPNVIPVTITCYDAEDVMFQTVVASGEMVTIQTSRLDTQAGISGFRLQIVITGVSE